MNNLEEFAAKKFEKKDVNTMLEIETLEDAMRARASYLIIRVCKLYFSSQEEKVIKINDMYSMAI